MGTETSVLQGCKLEDPLLTPSQKDWTIHPAQQKDGSPVSVFVHKKQEAESLKGQHLENAARQLKILRHPTILKFFASCENVDGTFLITERVKPLDLVIDNISPEEICAGLYNIVEALSFLHERGGVSHNNVCMSSVYVSSLDGGWRLGGMEHLCKFEDATVQFLTQSKPLRNAQSIPPEEDEESLTSTAPSYGHARDAYAFGILAHNMLEYLGDLGEMTDTFESSIEEILDLEPTKRPKLSTLMTDKLFKNDFLEITNFVKKLTLKCESEKNAFFEGLASRLYLLPKQLVASRLAPLLLCSFVLAEPMAISHLFPHLLVPCRNVRNKRHQEFIPGQVNPLVPLDLFKRHIVPVLGKIFPSRELHVCSLLLRHFSGYVDLFSEDTLKAVILPQLLIGLKDLHDDIAAASLRALADLVPILGAQTVVGGERVKYFIEGRPKFSNQQESQLHKLDHVTYLTAVSGVITISAMTDQLVPQSAVGSKITTSNLENRANVTSVTYNGDANQEDLKKQDQERQKEERTRRRQEREKRREEMHRKNEEKRKEREKKEAQIGKVTLASLAECHSQYSPPHSSADVKDSTPLPPVSFITPQGAIQQLKTPSDSDEMVPESQEVSDESDSDKADWSDWEDVDRGKKEKDSIQSRDLATPSQSSCWSVADKVGSKLLDESRTSDRNNMTDDWSNADVWNERATHLPVACQKIPHSKKKPSILQPKSSAKKNMEVKPIEESELPWVNTFKKPAGKEDKENQITGNTTKTSHKHSKPMRHNQMAQELGKEYDISEITVVKSKEPDFFADMEPTFSFQGAASSNSAATTEPSNGKRTDRTVILSDPISFAVDDSAVMEDSDAWGEDDDFNWNVNEES